MKKQIHNLLRGLAGRIYCPPPSSELVELRVRARLAWNNWPDTPHARKTIAAQEKRDPFSASSWDRVISVIQFSTDSARAEGNDHVA